MGTSQLERRDGSPADSSSRGERDLREALSHPEHARQPAEPRRVHRAMVRTATYQRLTDALSAHEGQSADARG